MRDEMLDRMGEGAARIAEKSAVLELHRRGVEYSTVNVDRLIVYLKAESKKAIGIALDDARVLMEGGRSGWISEAFNQAFIDAGKRAAESYVAGVAA